MKKLFYSGLALLAVFEILKVYFIMPMPGSQKLDTIDAAYFLHSYQWYFRTVFICIILLSAGRVLRAPRKWIPLACAAVVLGIIYFFNFEMMADKMFLQPERLTFKGRAENSLSDSTVVIAISSHGEAKAYPLRFIVYHHQVRDTLSGKPVMVTYCSVCRSGRVFEPLVNGKGETFRLVGMDHFNAMFEDASTKSWWRQATGEAITGSLKGSSLPEIPSQQITANKFFTLFPFGQMMQLEKEEKVHYDSTARFEKGKSKSYLTRTDSLSWNDKSWVVGLMLGKYSKAYDWNDLRESRVIHDIIGGSPVVIALSSDEQSFAAFMRSGKEDSFRIVNDTLVGPADSYDFSGRSLNAKIGLIPVNAYQEFWHSWRTFHPDTDTFRH
jgi:hypothetical protein